MLVIRTRKFLLNLFLLECVRVLVNDANKFEYEHFEAFPKVQPKLRSVGNLPQRSTQHPASIHKDTQSCVAKNNSFSNVHIGFNYV